MAAGGILWLDLGAGSLAPADRVGQAAHVDREEVDSRVDIFPDRDAPAFLAGLHLGGRHLDAVEEPAAGIFAEADRLHCRRHKAVEVRPVRRQPFAVGDRLEGFEHEVGKKPERCRKGFRATLGRIRLASISIRHQQPPATEVFHPIEQVPDPLSLHPRLSRGHVDVEHPRGLEGELKAPDIAGILAAKAAFDKRRVRRRHLRHPGERGLALSDLQQVGPLERVVGGRVWRDHRQHPGSQPPESRRIGPLSHRGYPQRRHHEHRPHEGSQRPARGCHRLVRGSKPRGATTRLRFIGGTRLGRFHEHHQPEGSGPETQPGELSAFSLPKPHARTIFPNLVDSLFCPQHTIVKVR